MNQLTEVKTTTASGGLVADYQYTARADGTRTGLLEKILNPDNATYATTQVIWAYDGLDRLIKETYDVNADGVGQAGSVAEGDYIDTYAYDSAGNQVSSASSGTTTTSLVDRQNPTGYSQTLEQHVNGSARPSTTYLVGLSMIAQTDGSGTTTYLLADGQGSTRQVATSSGVVTAVYNYDAFGNAIGFNAATASTQVLYTGQQFEGGIGEYNLRARSYDPSVGRFLTQDTFDPKAGDLLNANLYSYVGNNSIDFIDPTGHDGLIGSLAVMSVANIINSIEFTGFSALALSVHGVEAGLSANQVLAQFLIGQAIGVGFLLGGAALGSVWGGLREGSLFASDSTAISEEAATAAAESEVELNAIFGSRNSLPEWASVRPTPQTAKNFEELAAQLGIKLRFNSAIGSPVTRAYGQSAEIVFPGRSLRDSALVDILDEFGHAIRVVNGEATIGRGTGSVLEILHHADIFGEWSLNDLLSPGEQEIAQEAEIFLRSLAKNIG